MGTDAPDTWTSNRMLKNVWFIFSEQDFGDPPAVIVRSDAVFCFFGPIQRERDGRGAVGDAATQKEVAETLAIIVNGAKTQYCAQAFVPAGVKPGLLGCRVAYSSSQ